MRRPDTLTGYLARTAAFAQQGELLCTLGLNYLLGDAPTRDSLAQFLSEKSGLEISYDLSWQPETRHDDGGRADLEGTVEGVTEVIIEAKLGATFGVGQLRSYASHLSAQNPDGFGLLAVLVPKNRLRAVAIVVKEEFALEGDEPPWKVQPLGIVIATICWEDLFDRLADGVAEIQRCDLEQLRGLYLALAGLDIAPINKSAVLAWRAREDDFKAIVDRASRKLTTDHRVFPLRQMEADYFCRYVCHHVNDLSPCFSIGLHDPFDPQETPIWMRYHHDTDLFPHIQQRARALANPVESGGHLWFPLEVLTDRDSEVVVDNIVAQAEAIHGAIWR